MSEARGHITLTNTGSGAILATEVEIAQSFWRRGKGLIGRKSLPEGYGLIIRPCGSIHMFFMSIPIDVLHVDKHDRIVKILHDIKPWRLGPIVRKSAWVVELPAGTAGRTGTRVGDTIAVVQEGAQKEEQEKIEAAAKEAQAKADDPPRTR